MSNATQVRFEPGPGGCVEIWLDHNPSAESPHVRVSMLAYSEQGQMMGAPPIAQLNAGKLNVAAVELNRVLEELAS